MRGTVADALLKHLEAEGVEYVFGVPGLSLVPFFAATLRNPAVKIILAKHEEGAAYMADGYARVKGTLGACFSTAGPGATNLVTGVASAYCDNIPVLVLTGQVETSVFGKGGVQDSSREGVDAVKLFEPITRHSAMLISKLKAIEDIDHAMRKALSGRRGPVHLSLPKDIMASEVEVGEVVPGRYRFNQEYFDRRLVIEAADQLVRAERPAILLGAGAVASGACGDIVELAELMNIPVATTPRAKGAFPEDHPLSLGVMGLCGSALAEEYLTSGLTDVLMVVGASLNQLTTMSWDPKLAPTKCMIHVDIEPSEIGKNYRADLALVGDARTVVNEIYFRVLRHAATEEERWQRRGEEFSRLKAEIAPFFEPEKMASEEVPIKPQRLVRELQEALPENAIFFQDIGNHFAWSMHYMRFQRPGAFIISFGLLPMGHGIAASIGGKLAAPDRPVVCLTGDGCFLMNGMEVATAVSNDVPVVWVVMNNGLLGMISGFQKMALGGRTVATSFKPVDCAAVARALGAEGFRVEKPGELGALLPEAIASRKPTVIDCVIDPAEVPPLAGFVKKTVAYFKTLDMS